jgi:hypothetical protein
MNDRIVHVSVFTRINVALGVLAFSLTPLVFIAGRMRAGAMEAEQWVIVIGALISLQLLLLVAQKKCSSEAVPFWRGLLLISASMRTGWLYTDVVLAVLAVPFALFAAVLFLASSNPAARFHRLVYRFYEHRMQQ